MEKKFHVQVRQHPNDAFTVSSLTHPSYAAFATTEAAATQELKAVLAGELALKAIEREAETHLGEFSRSRVELEIRAVQHGRLVNLPMRVTLIYREDSDRPSYFDVWLPRLGQRFQIRGESAIRPWAEELIRGRFHLRDIEEVRRFEYDRGERVEELIVAYRPIDGTRLEKVRERYEIDEEEDDSELESAPTDSVFDGRGEDLCQSVRLGHLRRVHGLEIPARALEDALVLGRSMLLIGPSGVGKTSLVHALAQHWAEHAPHRQLWHVTPTRAMAGAIYLGQWQEKVLQLLRAARAAGAVLYWGDLLEAAMRTQAGGSTGLSLGRLLLPWLRERQVTMVFEATPEALARAESLEPALTQALRPLTIAPLGAEKTRELLVTLSEGIARKHRTRFERGAVERALELVLRFGDAEGLPGSALHLLESVARGESSERASSSAPASVRTIRDATSAFARESGFPEELVSLDTRLEIRKVESFLSERVRGQDEAVRRMSDVVAVLEAGLTDPERPIASFLFLGPTGVGKTESALSLAEYLFGDRKRVVRLDMSEYSYPGAAIRLVDGRGGEGALTRPIRQQPFTVLLLDEIEKASGEVFDILLSVLGEGRLTDSTGRTVSFRHTIVVLTSNLGASSKSRVGIGAELVQGPEHYLTAARRFFRPEFLNRLDHIVPFLPLDAESLRGIAARLIAKALEREGFLRRGIRVTVSPRAIDFLAATGFDPEFGARPMKRAIDARLLVPLGSRLARGEADSLEVDVDGDDLVFLPTRAPRTSH